jgi:NRAMP (natural resistance-associated macrophage protein)-like metal ion transporter
MNIFERLRGGALFRKLGPGLITGAADDDPSGIATYSQAGAQFGFALLWTLLFAYPLMVAVQLISAQVGRVTGQGLACNLQKAIPAWVLTVLVILLFVANTINIGADLVAMGSAAELLVGSGQHLFTLGFALLSLTLQMFLPYERYASILKWLTLVLLAYVALLAMVTLDWGRIAHGMFVPTVPRGNGVTTIVAILGTTISPYLFFWQASQEVEEIEQQDGREPLREAPTQAHAAFDRIRWDTFGGMAVSNIVAIAIIIGTAATLHASGKTNIESAAQAAEALRPLAGELAFLFFSLGIIGTGLLAVPVLAGSAAYAICESRGWKIGLNEKPHQAIAFYGIIAAATVLGIVVDLLGINPISALYWSAVINGVTAVPILVAMMLIARRAAVMQRFRASPLVTFLGWVTAISMGVAAVAMAFT